MNRAGTGAQRINLPRQKIARVAGMIEHKRRSQNVAWGYAGRTSRRWARSCRPIRVQGSPCVCAMRRRVAIPCQRRGAPITGFLPVSENGTLRASPHLRTAAHARAWRLPSVPDGRASGAERVPCGEIDLMLPVSPGVIIVHGHDEFHRIVRRGFGPHGRPAGLQVLPA
jgi:hypothetical protein